MSNNDLSTKVVVRLEHSIYMTLENKLSRTVITSATSELAAGYALGVEAVLKELRNGYTVDAQV